MRLNQARPRHAGLLQILQPNQNSRPNGFIVPQRQQFRRKMPSSLNHTHCGKAGFSHHQANNPPHSPRRTLIRIGFPSPEKARLRLALFPIQTKQK
jgi:hypothetical protein